MNIYINYHKAACFTLHKPMCFGSFVKIFSFSMCITYSSLYLNLYVLFQSRLYKYFLSLPMKDFCTSMKTSTQQWEQRRRKSVKYKCLHEHVFYVYVCKALYLFNVLMCIHIKMECSANPINQL